MIDLEDLEAFLLRMETPYQELEPGMWLIGEGQEAGPVVVHYSPPLLLLRVEVMDVPQEEELQRGLFRTLLELNATDLVHGAYGLDGSEIVLTDALELADLDFSEFQASLDSVMVALSSHYQTLSQYRTP